MLKVKIKKLHPDAVIPVYAKYGDAGMDLTAISKTTDKMGNVVYGTGLSFEIPEGFVGLLFPRSSNAKTDLLLTNAVGVLDSGYRGEVMFKYSAVSRVNMHMAPGHHVEYLVGDRIGQLMIIPYPKIQFEQVEELAESERGAGGYGSTGA